MAWAAGEYFLICLYKNGVAVSVGYINMADAAVTEYKQSTLSDVIYLEANDYIDIRVQHTQGAAINLFGNYLYNYFSVHRLS